MTRFFPTRGSPRKDLSSAVDLSTNVDVKSRHLAKVSGRYYANHPSQGISS